MEELNTRLKQDYEMDAEKKLGKGWIRQRFEIVASVKIEVDELMGCLEDTLGKDTVTSVASIK